MSVIKMPVIPFKDEDDQQIPNGALRVDSDDFEIVVPGGPEDPILKLKNDGSSGDSLWEEGEGENSVQTKDSGCHAKGESSVAEGYMSFAGVDDVVEDWREGKGAHAEGGNTTAAGNFSHTEGNSTVTNNPYEHAEGLFNYSHYSQPVYPDAGNTIHSVGIGSNIQNRKNAWEIMQNGDAYLIGVGGYDGTNPGEASTLQESLGGSSGEVVLVDVYATGNNIVANKTVEELSKAFMRGERVIANLWVDDVLCATYACLEYVNKTLGFGSYIYDSTTDSAQPALYGVSSAPADYWACALLA